MPANQPIQSPSGLDLHPAPPNPVRVSKRATGGLIFLGVILLAALAYGGYRRSNQVAAKQKEAAIPSDVAPAPKEAAMEAAKAVPVGVIPMAAKQTASADTLVPPAGSNSATVPTTTTDPQHSVPQVATGFPGQPQYASTESVSKEQTPEEKRRQWEEQREQEAMLPPTSTKAVSTVSNSQSASTTNDLAAIEQMTKSLTANSSKTAPSVDLSQVAQKLGLVTPDAPETDAQSEHEAFLSSQKKPTADYLTSTKRSPLTPYEIKAGWEIPAILEQSLNSDLPGELKALVTTNVYDTAEGKYLLIPQGARLLGKYDSRVAFGQDGVPIVWNRTIFPDGSSLDLEGMEGLDSHGDAGLRGSVDRHYKRIIGFAALTSLMSAGFAISQNRNTSALTYPSWQQSAATGVGQSVNEVGSQLTRRNLNVPPTVKAPAGTRFVVRVNKDIVFEQPYKAKTR